VSSIDNLKKEAKHWLKALRGGSADARARLARAYPGAADPPVLRDVQHALAREHGFENWRAFADALARPEGDAPPLGRTPLHVAVVNQDRAAVEALLARGANLDARDAAGLTALDLAALDSQRGVAERLIAHGATVQLPAAIALQRDADVLRTLRHDPNAIRAGFAWGTLIVAAAAKAPAAVMETLIRHGAAVNGRVNRQLAQDETGYTPLHEAARHGNLEAIRVLLQYGGSPRIRDGESCATPAAWAHAAGHAAARDLILASRRVDLFDAITQNRPDLIPAILQRDPGALTRPFQRYAPCAAVPDALRPGPETTPLEWAAARGDGEAVRLLTEFRDQGGPHADDPIATFLGAACWDHHVHGKSDHRMYDRAAQRLLAERPAIARHDLYTAVVCGELEEVRRLLAASPEAARAAGGARHWTPLLYLCYTRFTHPPTLTNAEAIARELLDHGADPNDFYMAGDSQYTALVGVAGEGEQDSPRQPWAPAVYQLLLDRGAGPYDIQVLYNTHFSTDMIWWLELTYQYTVAHGMKADWDDPAWSMLDMGGYGPGSYFVIYRAMGKDNAALVEWALAHGADPNVMSSSHRKFHPKRSLLDEAELRGSTTIVDLLRRHGAQPGPGGTLEPKEAFLQACIRLDRAKAAAILEQHPHLRSTPESLFVAARHDRPDALALLADLGFSLDMADAHNTRALHHAAGANALGAAAFLIERGVEIDPRETNWGGAPIGWAGHSDHREMLDFLSRYSRNIWTLTFRGYVDRVREILRDDPSLARQVSSDKVTPLWWLPDEEDKAMALVELLLAAGADPSVTSVEGGTAADQARQRGMTAVAARLESR
jgi:uncharacterized protein